MFFHYLRYNLLSMLRTKEVVFWTFLFPIALSTFMFAAFGNIIETTEMANPIPVAVIYETEDPIFEKVVETVSTGKDAILEVKNLKEKEALNALKKGDITGIYYVNDKISLQIKGDELQETVLSGFLDEYLQRKESLTLADMEACKEKITSQGNLDNLVSYFYAILAMSCLFASFNGLDRIKGLQANLSTLGARRGVAPTKKSVIILSEFLAGLLLQFAVTSVAFLYMWKVLGVNFGSHVAQIFPILLLGSASGLSLGMFIGALKFPRTINGKMGFAVSFSMLLSVADDLCAPNIRITIEHYLPIFNRINPAALVSDAFYALSVYDTYTRYITNLCYLGAITFVLCAASYLVIRRNRYASL